MYIITMVFVRLIEDAFTRAETRMYKDVATTMSISSRRYEGRKAADNEEDIRRRGTDGASIICIGRETISWHW